MTTQNPSKPNILAIGLAMFSMFFGSGNIVFPVLIGQEAGSMAPFAIMGLLFTAVLLPFLGLISISLFQGDYMSFFGRLGKWPAWFIVVVIMALIGPFAVIPRCIIISFAALKVFIPSVELIPFSLVSCVLLFLLTFRRSSIMDILGKYLTPFLLLSLFAIIYQGFQMPHGELTSSFTKGDAFLFGWIEGYKTMDIFAAFMFSSVVLNSIRTSFPTVGQDRKKLLTVCFQAGSIGIGFLALIYIGMCFVAAYHGAGLKDLPEEQVLAALAMRILGSAAGIPVCIAVSLACLTTAISLAAVFSDFVSSRLSQGRVSYQTTLFVSMVISFIVSTFQFSGIQGFLVPILKVTLPCLILLALLNFLFKVYRVQIVRIPVFVVFLLTLYFYLQNHI